MSETNDSSIPVSPKLKTPSIKLPLSAPGNFSATCEVTNRIDINKYFEHLKEECTKSKSVKSPRVLKKTVSSSKLELQSSFNTTRKKKANYDKQKRKSVGDSTINTILLLNENESEIEIDSSGISSPRQTVGYFNYDISEGHMVEPGRHDNNDCLVSRQKSWDLSLSKQRSSPCCSEYDYTNTNNSGEDLDCTVTYSAGDFKRLFNKNRVTQSKSCECLSNLGQLHRERAMNHGRIYSVSEQNRRLRRKYYRKDRKTSDDGSASGGRSKLRRSSLDSDMLNNNIESLVEELHLHEN